MSVEQPIEVKAHADDRDGRVVLVEWTHGVIGGEAAAIPRYIHLSAAEVRQIVQAFDRWRYRQRKAWRAIDQPKRKA